MEAVGVVSDRDRVEALFTAFGAERIEAFLSGCSEQLLVTFRGTSDAPTVFGRPDVASWWAGLKFLAGGPVTVDVALVMATGPSIVVVLGYSFVRDGRARRYETVNYCTLRHGALAAWFASPLERREYAEAWGVADASPATRRTNKLVGAPAP